MVTARKPYLHKPGEQLDAGRWLDELARNVRIRDRDELQRALQWSQKAAQQGHEASNRWSGLIDSYDTGLEMAEILAELHLDQEAIVAAILYRAVREESLPLLDVRNEFGDNVANLVQGVLRMAAISSIAVSTDSVLGQTGSQIENVRRMLVALVDDVRVALIKLAERTCAIRAVKDAPDDKRIRVAREIFDIYAPLAHRLGIGQIKWELEDLSFRYLEPDAYLKIAQLLDEKRLIRESYIRDIQLTLGEALERMAIKADVAGRAKHIYSIWRKMQRKGIDFSQVYDVRAVRVLVPEIRDCYAALGVVHSLWSHIPREFDDYIANPKKNGYRSLHTAVIGPDGRTLEVQIRTHEMHDEAELGVCAHYYYKESVEAGDSELYEKKIAWLRQVLEWQEELGDISGLVDLLRADVRESRVYVFTPDGHVVDLLAGSTPVDFAYHVHTEVGHQCRGARVNGHIVQLNTPLDTGDRVEILTGRVGGPSRDWLNPNLNYVHTSRARAKVQHWFKQQARGDNVRQGRELLEAELRRLAITDADLEALAPKVNYHSVEDLYAAIGAGDLRISQVLHAMPDLAPRPQEGPRLRQKESRPSDPDQVLIRGVGNLLTQLAGCCQPVPGDAVRGYITQGRGVSVHRRDCGNLLQLEEDEPQRVIEVDWGRVDASTFPVEIEIVAYDRPALLRDITSILANEKINVSAVHSSMDAEESRSSMRLTLEISDNEALGRVVDKLRQIPNVSDVRRQRA